MSSLPNIYLSNLWSWKPNTDFLCSVISLQMNCFCWRCYINWNSKLPFWVTLDLGFCHMMWAAWIKNSFLLLFCLFISLIRNLRWIEVSFASLIPPQLEVTQIGSFLPRVRCQLRSGGKPVNNWKPRKIWKTLPVPHLMGPGIPHLLPRSIYRPREVPFTLCMGPTEIEQDPTSIRQPRVCSPHGGLLGSPPANIGTREG